MTSVRRTLLLLLAAGTLALPYDKPPVAPVSTSDQLAIRGYDAVAYFTESAPKKGDPAFRHEWRGATWLFASADHRDRFAADPERYAPQYGGYCAWAVGHNYTAPTDPTAWKVIDGKLYLNYNAQIQQKWDKERASLIRQADQNWPKLHQPIK